MLSLVPVPGPVTSPPVANLADLIDFIAVPIIAVTAPTTVPMAASISIHVALELVAVLTAFAIATPCAMATSAIANSFAARAISSLVSPANSNKEEIPPIRFPIASDFCVSISTSLSASSFSASR